MSGRSQLAAKDPQERRRRILAAAIEVLEDKGFAGTRIADIAAVAGTSPALVVYHFKTLDGALAEALGSVPPAKKTKKYNPIFIFSYNSI